MMSWLGIPSQKRSAMTMTVRMQMPEIYAMVFLWDFMNANLRKEQGII